jgi:hypothetical protein
VNLEESRLSGLAAAVADGTSVDWNAAESSASGNDTSWCDNYGRWRT